MPTNKMPKIVEEILSTYEKDGGINHIEGSNLPSREATHEIVMELLNILFPGYYEKHEIRKEDVSLYIWEKIVKVYHSLSREIAKALQTLEEFKDKESEELMKIAGEKTISFLSTIPRIRQKLAGDVVAAYEGDPAAKSLDEIILSYPGLEAIAIYRVAHELYLLNIPLIPRIMTEFAHRRTGIDIHPGATIGENFFIDHGTGVVIGETCEIGNNVRIYQGVTLGALSFKKDKDGKLVKGGKRHPTIEDNVVIYAGATILGGETVVGRNSVIGGNVWLLQSVPPNTTLAHQPPELISKKREKEEDKMYYI